VDRGEVAGLTNIGCELVDFAVDFWFASEPV
jgi:hypothetical protein